MNRPDAAPEEPREALAREAARWFARMRGPDAEASRDAFEAWLGAGPEHRSAYNRAAEIFSMGKLLGEADALPTPRPPHRLATFAIATAGACAIAAGGWMAMHPGALTRGTPAVTASAGDQRTVSTLAGETRVVRLADGSTIRLGRDTSLQVTIDAGSRTLRLTRGQARFEVAHEHRPFVVFAGGGSVTARGTIFEVGLVPSGRVQVQLVQGVIDVALPRQPQKTGPAAVRRLAAGEGLSFTAAPSAVAAAGGSGAALPAPAAASGTIREFQAVQVAALIAEANRGAARPLRLADPSLGARRVSGRFRVDDTGLLAERLGALFGGEVDRSNPREIVLR